jgi:alpha-beta hydrolase superfamily lysophospholipase
MVRHEYTWESYDQLKLFGQSWIPHKKPKAVINLVHGFKDHSGRFEKWAIRFAGSGYAVIAVDLRGHGRSGGRRGYAPGFNSYLKDVNVLRQQSVNLFGDIPHVLYGHSLGGNIVVNYMITEDLQPQLAIVTSPWFTLTSKPSSFRLILAQTVRYILPGLLVKSSLDPDGLSRDKKVVDEYLSDPLVHDSILPRLFFEIENFGDKASRSIYKINVPLLVMHGSDDPITSVKLTRNFVMNAGMLTTYKEWPDAYHELHNDIIGQEVFDYVLDWLDQKLKVKS